MTNSIGWTIFAATRGLEKLLFPLAYGMPHQPAPECLLDRGHIQVFATNSEARDALKRSLTIEDQIGSLWHKKCDFVFFAVKR